VTAGEGDVVVSDVVMPDDNLFDLLPRMRKVRPELPVIVMSAQNTFMTAIRASEKGAYEYLPKPFDLVELTGIVGRALAESRRKTGSDEGAIRRSRRRNTKACRWSAGRRPCRTSTACWRA
jgi:two-component system nitrogen regulation response regulator GlnG